MFNFQNILTPKKTNRNRVGSSLFYSFVLQRLATTCTWNAPRPTRTLWIYPVQSLECSRCRRCNCIRWTQTGPISSESFTMANSDYDRGAWILRRKPRSTKKMCHFSDTMIRHVDKQPLKIWIIRINFCPS